MSEVESQLARWGTVIERMSDRTRKPGVQPGFETLLHCDVLKALHVITRAKCDEYHAAPAAEQARVKVELVAVWTELADAIGKPRP